MLYYKGSTTCFCDKYPDKNNFREKVFILAHSSVSTYHCNKFKSARHILSKVKTREQ